MEECKNCVYSSHAPWYRQTGEVALNMVVVATGAAVVNGIVLFLAGQDDLFPGVIGGSSVAASTTGLHLLGHTMDSGKVKGHPHNRPGDLEVVSELSLIVLSTAGLMYYGLKRYEYKLTRWEFAGLKALSFGGAGLTTRCRLEYEKKP